MAKSITTSIRLELSLNKKLEKAAYDLHRGKNWLITEAILMYLKQLENSSLAEEAKQQSLLVSKMEKSDNDLWETNSDQTNWTF
ncbi:ribbon-helix-helix protein, CopG family [Rickettsia endosymbiont of Lasioglossum villosulum]|uniref:ribbon-helix-helix protein, CopG family n=1 Tax=Rickettsia endosymbiont of Lasioglossum villosulum TaxID=3066269 RepID=UPI003132AEA0